MKSIKYLFVLFAIISTTLSFSQNTLLSSGPMSGYSEMKEVPIWLQTKSCAEVFIKYRLQGTKVEYFTNKIQTDKETGFTALLIADTLEPGNIYDYDVYVNGIKEVLPFETVFKTQKLWKWRTDAPDFSFLMGSGAYINEEKYDRPGKPYGGDYKIYNAMTKENPDFMIWLGDNIYLRDPDWNSWTGIVHRYTQARTTPEMREFMSSTHNYAILDDHDYGPNDSDRGFWNKNQTLEAFELFWANPSYGVGEINGAITSFEYADCEFFLLDNRSYRTPNRRKTGDKTIMGEDQLQWLFDNISSSYAKFKFIVVGGQILSTSKEYESYSNYGFEKERQRIIDFIYKEEIKNVVILSGDVHFSEVSVLRKKNKPTIWDLTSSPLNSGFNNNAINQNNDLRIPESVIMKRNYTKISLVGNKAERHLLASYYDSDGKLIYEIKIQPE